MTYSFAFGLILTGSLVIGINGATHGSPRGIHQGKVHRRDSAGIQIVSTSEPTLGVLAWSLAPKPVTRILFSPSEHGAGSAARLKSGGILLTRPQIGKLRLEWYRPNGSLERQVDAGAGPVPNGCDAVPAYANWGLTADAMVAWHWGVLYRFNGNGRLLDCRSLEIPPSLFRKWDKATPVSGGLVVEMTTRDPGLPSDEEAGAIRYDTVAYALFRNDGSFARIVAIEPGPRQVTTDTLVPFGLGRLSLPYALDGYPKHTANGNLVFITSGIHPEITAYDTAGKLRTIIRWAERRRPVTAAMIDAYRNEFRETDARSSESIRRMTQAMRDGAGFSDSLGVVGAMIPMVDGGVWAAEIRAPDAPKVAARWRVFDNTGAWLTTVEIPFDKEILEAGRDNVILRWRTADTMYIEVYPLAKRSQ